MLFIDLIDVIHKKAITATGQRVYLPFGFPTNGDLPRVSRQSRSTLQPTCGPSILLPIMVKCFCQLRLSDETGASAQNVNLPYAHGKLGKISASRPSVGGAASHRLKWSSFPPKEPKFN